MSIAREPIYQALFTKVATAAGVTTATRVVRTFNSIEAAKYPIVMFEEKREKITVKSPGLNEVYEMHVDVAVFILEPDGSEPVGEETVIPAADLNTILDAIRASIAPDAATNYQTLGGLCQHVWIEGIIEKFPAVLGKGTPVSIAVIPFVILAA